MDHISLELVILLSNCPLNFRKKLKKSDNIIKSLKRNLLGKISEIKSLRKKPFLSKIY